MPVRVFACVYIAQYMYSMCEEHVAFSGRIEAVSLMFFSFFFFSSFRLIEQTRPPISARLRFFSYEASLAVLWKSYVPRFTPGPQSAGNSSSQMFWGCKIKKCLHASLPVYLRVSLSLGDSHAVSLVFLLLISVRRRMVAECQLSLKHLFPANNSLCRCLVLAEGSPIASSLLTQNNNADECHLLVMFLFSIVYQV